MMAANGYARAERFGWRLGGKTPDDDVSQN